MEEIETRAAGEQQQSSHPDSHKPSMWVVAEHRAQELLSVAERRLLTERYLDGDAVTINLVNTSFVSYWHTRKTEPFISVLTIVSLTR